MNKESEMVTESGATQQKESGATRVTETTEHCPWWKTHPTLNDTIAFLEMAVDCCRVAKKAVTAEDAYIMLKMAETNVDIARLFRGLQHIIRQLEESGIDREFVACNMLGDDGVKRRIREAMKRKRQELRVYTTTLRDAVK
jgi:hypothetical protein